MYTKPRPVRFLTVALPQLMFAIPKLARHFSVLAIAFWYCRSRVVERYEVKTGYI
jgi:hypothetical protein